MVEPFPGGNGSADTGVQTRVIAQRASTVVLNIRISNTESCWNGSSKESPRQSGVALDLTSRRSGLEPGHMQRAVCMCNIQGDIDD